MSAVDVWLFVVCAPEQAEPTTQVQCVVCVAEGLMGDSAQYSVLYTPWSWSSAMSGVGVPALLYVIWYIM